MYIEPTKRLISVLSNYNKNMRDSDAISSIEKQIIGSKIACLSDPKEENARKAIIDYLCQVTEIDHDFINNEIAPVQIIEQSRDVAEYNSLLAFHTGLENDKYEFSLDEQQEGNVFFMRSPIYNNDFSIRFYFGVHEEKVPTMIYYKKDQYGNREILSAIDETEYSILLEASDNAFGTVCFCNPGNCFFLYLLSKNTNIDNVIVLDTDDDSLDLAKQITSHINLPFKCVFKKVTNYCEYIEENKDYISFVFMDPWKCDQEAFQIYKEFVKTEKRCPSIVFKYCFEDGLIYMVRSMVLQYLSAKLGSKSYQDFFKTIAPGIYDLFEKQSDVINIPQQLDYYLGRTFAKECIALMK